MKRLFTILFLSFCWLSTNAQNCLEITIDTTQLACYDEATGQILITVHNSPGPFRVSWDGNLQITADTFITIDSIAAGEYELLIRDGDGCDYDGLVEIPQAPEILSQVSGYHCNGCWCFTADASGGLPPYSYEWSNGDTSDFIVYCEIDPYYLTITDANGCNITQGVTVAIVSVPLSISQSSISPTSCYGVCDASINIDLFGGVQPFEYEWSNGATVQDPSELCGGVHYLTVVDASNEFFTTSFIIPEPEKYTFETIDIFPATACGSECNGYIYGAIEGGVPPYDFIWQGPNGFTAATEDILDLCEGTYHLSVTDSTNCVVTTSYEITCLLPLSVETVIEHPSCVGCCDASVNLIPSGGLAPYSYTWNSEIDSSYMDGLCASLNIVVVTDSLGNEFELEVLLEAPSSLFELSSLETYVLGSNPINDILAVSFETKAVQQWDINLVNTSGAILVAFAQNKTYPIGTHQATIAVEAIPSGVYFLCFYTKNEVVKTLKVVKL